MKARPPNPEGRKCFKKTPFLYSKGFIISGKRYDAMCKALPTGISC